MPYRDDQPALETLRDELRRDLADAARHAAALADAERQKAELTRELAAVEAEIERQKSRRLPLLESIRIASPCSARWEEMRGDDRVRFCGSCEKSVYNLSAMTSAEAEALLAERGGDVCVRLYRRADGTVMTTDCPVGQRRRRVKRAVAAFAGAGALAAAGALMASPARGGHAAGVEQMMGTPTADPPAVTMGAWSPPPQVTQGPSPLTPPATGVLTADPRHPGRPHAPMGRPAFPRDANQGLHGKVLAR